MDLNIHETRFIPDKPKVLANEQIEIYIPTASYSKPGTASFDSKGFIVDAKGNVKLRRDSVRNVANFSVDWEEGYIYVTYDDGTKSTIKIPTKTNTLYVRNNLTSYIEITPSSFVLDENTGHWFVPFSPSETGFDNADFMASLELAGSVDDGYDINTTGFYTVVDSVFKGDDGSLLISVDNEDAKEQFYGRVLLLGGDIYTEAGEGGVSSGLGLGETAGTAYEGSKGKANAEAIKLLQTNKQDKLVAGANVTIEGNVISAVGGGTANEEDILNKILDPDNYPLSENTNENVYNIELEEGKLSRTDGSERDGEGGLRMQDYLSVNSFSTMTPVFETTDGVTDVCAIFYDSNYKFQSYAYIGNNVTFSISSSASYVRCYISTTDTTGTLTLNFGSKVNNATKAKHKKVYLADHGYSIYGAEIDDDDTMHKVVICAEGEDGNEYNITEIRAPDSDPKEATVCLMNSGNGITQFADFSSMVYKNKPEVVIVCQTRGGKQLPKFAVQFNDGDRKKGEEGDNGRVSKFTVHPNAIPIELTKDGIRVKTNNSDYFTEDDEYVTINLIDLLDQITALGTNKQDKLTAGDNIIISSDGIISAIGGSGTGGGLTQSQVESIVKNAIVDKQDKLVFDGTYDADSNKVATVQTVADKIAEVVAGADTSFDTLKEIAEWIKAHPEDVAELNTLVQENKDSIQSLESSKQDKLTAGDNITIHNGVISATGGGSEGGLGEASVRAIAQDEAGKALTEAKEYTDEKAVDSVGATVEGQELTVEIKDKAGNVIATTTVTLPSGGVSGDYVEKVSIANAIYGTDVNGNPKSYTLGSANSVARLDGHTRVQTSTAFAMEDWTALYSALMCWDLVKYATVAKKIPQMQLSDEQKADWRAWLGIE
jgi:hypothetical protein